MSGWRQAVFLRQRRIDVIQRALSSVLDAEAWSPATPRRLYVGAADASSRGWTMIVPELANFFLDRGGMTEPRLCRLARELRCPAYEVDVREPEQVTLYEVDELGRTRISGAIRLLVPGVGHDDAAVASARVGFGLVPISDDIRDRVNALAAECSGSEAGPLGPVTRGRSIDLADYLGAVAGFPGWTRYADDPITAGELIYEPPRILANGTGRITALPETRAAIARTVPRVDPGSFDRKGRRPRSVSRPRR
jgi:hypothetical protein